MKPLAALLISSTALAQTAEVSESQKCRPAAPGELVEVQIEEGKELRELVAWASALTCRSFTYDAEIADWEVGIEFYAAELTVEDAYRVFLVALRGSGLRALARGSRVTIVPAKAAREKARGPAKVVDVNALLPAAIPIPPEPAPNSRDLLHEMEWAILEELRGDPSEAVLRSSRFEPVPSPLGVQVVYLRPGGVADRGGLEVGDVVHAVNGRPAASLNSLRAALSTIRRGQTATVQLTRNRRPVTLLLHIR